METFETYRMPIDKLRDRVHDNVCSVIERVLKIGACEGIIHSHLDPVSVGDLRNPGNIHDGKQRVGRGLKPDKFGLARDNELFQICFDVGGEGAFSALFGGKRGQVLPRSTIHVGYRNDM